MDCRMKIIGKVSVMKSSLWISQMFSSLMNCQLSVARLIAVVAAIVTAVWSTDHADAQLVRVGPFGGVSVRVPFVSVDTLPFGGGTRVRAPLTAVDTGLFRPGFYGYGFDYGRGYGYTPYSVYRSPFYGYAPYRGFYGPTLYRSGFHLGTVAVPVAPAVAYAPIDPFDHARSQYEQDIRERAVADAQRELAYGGSGYSGSGYSGLAYRAARPNYQSDVFAQPPSDPVAEVSLRLRQSAARLARSLESLGDASEVWLEFLKPQLIVNTIDGLEEEFAIERFITLLDAYSGTAGNVDLTHVWSLDGFHQTHDGLRKWLDIQQGIVPIGVVESGMSATGAAESIMQNPVDPSNLPAPESFESLPPGTVRGSL